MKLLSAGNSFQGEVTSAHIHYSSLNGSLDDFDSEGFMVSYLFSVHSQIVAYPRCFCAFFHWA